MELVDLGGRVGFGEHRLRDFAEYQSRVQSGFKLWQQDWFSQSVNFGGSIYARKGSYRLIRASLFKPATLA